MKRNCDYCLDDIEFITKKNTLACKHKFCGNCYRDFENKNIFSCPFEGCMNESEMCGKHGKKLEFFCEDEFLLICDQCFDDHREHIIKPIDMLDNEITKEINKELTVGYKTLYELESGLEKFISEYNNSLKVIDELDEQFYKLTKKIDYYANVNRITDLIQNDGIQVVFDWKKVNLPERVEIIKYLKDSRSVANQSSTLYEKFEKIPDALSKSK